MRKGDFELRSHNSNCDESKMMKDGNLVNYKQKEAYYFKFQAFSLYLLITIKGRILISDLWNQNWIGTLSSLLKIRMFGLPYTSI